MRERIRQILQTNREAGFTRACLDHNLRALLLVTAFLAVEQLLYGLFVQRPNTTIGRVHLMTASVSAVFAMSAHHIKRRIETGATVKGGYTLLPTAIGLFFFVVAILRAVYVPDSAFAIPAIYVAVIYGFAFIAFIPPKQSLLLYGSTLLLFFGFLNSHGVHWTHETLVADLVANNLLAWLASILAYRRFEREYEGRKVVADANRELLRLSTTDMLTTLNNRRKLDAHLASFHEVAEHGNQYYAVILADIDHFKRVNDRYGHHKGDEVLKEVAAIIRTHIRKKDIVGRWGGEEFLILCSDTGAIEAAAVAEKLRKLIEVHAFSIPEKMTCSFGISTYQRGSFAKDVVKWADEALYQSKSDGRNRVTRHPETELSLRQKREFRLNDMTKGAREILGRERVAHDDL